MIIPVRCFTCGSLIADKQADFISRVKNGESPDKVLEDLEVRRYCCRRMLLSSVDVIDELIPYFEALYRRHAEFQTDKF